MAFTQFRFIALSIILILPACGNEKNTRGGPPFGEYNLDMKVGGYDGGNQGKPKNVNAFQSADEFRNALNAVDKRRCPPNGNLKKCLKEIRKKDNTGNDALKGIAGITTHQFLRVAQSTVRNDDDSFTKADVDVSGQIQQNCLHDQSLPGYEYNELQRKLRFCIVMTTTIKHPGGNNSGTVSIPDPETRHQYFHVEVTRDVRVDNGAGGSDVDVFPTAASKTGIVIPKSKVDMFTPPLNHKLYAWGTRIRVVTFWETDETANGRPDWANGVKFARGPNGQPPVILPSVPNRKRFLDYFKVSRKACIDMMFYGAPPHLLDPSKDLPGVSYCLGRCQHPPIVNTR